MESMAHRGKKLMTQGKFVVVTNCTARKRSGVPLTRLKPEHLGAGLELVANRWVSSLRLENTRLPAGQLYVGRSISEAKLAAEFLDAELFIVSAGLGLVGAKSLVPGYDLSVTGTKSELSAVLRQYGASKADWWELLTSGQGLRWLMQTTPQAVVLVALPNDYLQMVIEDLQSMTTDEASRIFVFTSEVGRRSLARLPHVTAMPYDERLESIPGYAGTRTDFPQRALRHFTATLGGHRLAPKDAIAAVIKAMSACAFRAAPKRQRLTDPELCQLIRQGWNVCGGNSVKLLRYLRDTRRVACEQGRFAGLRQQVKRELTEATTAPE